ncbi:MAG: hypothetical protein Q9218_005090 [Villophora microphyllina]
MPHDLRDATSTKRIQEVQSRDDEPTARTQEGNTQTTTPKGTISDSYQDEIYDPSPTGTSHTAKPDRTISNIYQDELYDPSSTGRSQVTNLPRTMSSIYTDELYNPSLPTPAPPQDLSNRKSAVFQDLLQAAQKNHVTLKPSSPKFPQGQSFTTVAQSRQQQKVESDVRNLQQHSSTSTLSPPPRTVSPKKIILDYNETEDDANMPLFPQNNGSHKSDSLSDSNESQTSRPWTVPANGFSVEDFLSVLAEQLQERLKDQHKPPIMRSELLFTRDLLVNEVVSLAVKYPTRRLHTGRNYISGDAFPLMCMECDRAIHFNFYRCSLCRNLCNSCQQGDPPQDWRGHLLTRVDLQAECRARSVEDAWKYIVDSFASADDDIDFVGVIHCWQRILPRLRQGYMLNRALLNWSIAPHFRSSLDRDRINPGPNNPSNGTIFPSGTDQEGERGEKNLDVVEPFAHGMQTSRLEPAFQTDSASSMIRDHPAPPPRQAAEQSKLRILYTIASWKESKATPSQLSVEYSLGGRSKGPSKEGSPFRRTASTPTPVAQGVSPEVTTQPSTSRGSSDAEHQGLTRIVNERQEWLHEDKSLSQPQHHLSWAGPGTPSNSSTISLNRLHTMLQSIKKLSGG